MKNAIKEFDFNYWVETGGIIENYFRKHKGLRIPNGYAHLLLEKSGIKLNVDGFHYSRTIGGDSEYEKVIVGLKDKRVYEQVLSEIDDYGKLRQIFSSGIDYSGNYCDSVQRMLFLVNRIDGYYDDGFTEMTPFMHKSLLNAVNILNKQPKDMTINSSLRHADFLLQSMPVIELHEFTDLNSYSSFTSPV